jgi:hypothetical protein
VRLLLVGVHEGLGRYIRSQLITIEALREQLGNAATIIRNTNNRGMLERVVKESFCRRLHYCIDNLAGHFE